MSNLYLILNAGSSSLKFSLYEMPSENELVNGLIEKIGETDSSYTLKFSGKKISNKETITNHDEAVKVMIDLLKQYNFIESINDIEGIGHRVLHGGEKYSNSVLISDEVVNDIKDLTKLGPLHHPKELAGIQSMKSKTNAYQVAVFDTAFHQTMPEENYMYGVPIEWYKNNGVRKYGFHGTSYKYITQRMQEKLNREDVNLIICHLGSGASIACIKNSKCLDTSMGLTPLDGLLMGTRSGSIDPSIIEYMVTNSNKTISEVMSDLNKKSGFLGISGVNDQRDLEALANQGDHNAILTLKMFRKSILKYIAEYYFELNGKIDALVFTAGIGENSIKLREDIVNTLGDTLNIKLDREANNNIARFKSNQEGIITKEDSLFPVWVVPTDEEKMILEDTYQLVKEKHHV